MNPSIAKVNESTSEASMLNLCRNYCFSEQGEHKTKLSTEIDLYANKMEVGR